MDDNRPLFLSILPFFSLTYFILCQLQRQTFLSQENGSESKKRERKAEVILGCLLFCRSALHATCIHYSTTPTSPWRPSFDKSQSERGRIASCFDPYPICTRNRLGSAGKSSSTVVIHMYWDGPLNWDKGCSSNIALLLRML